jgi:hypothetical protein
MHLALLRRPSRSQEAFMAALMAFGIGTLTGTIILLSGSFVRAQENLTIPSSLLQRTDQLIE